MLRYLLLCFPQMFGLSHGALKSRVTGLQLCFGGILLVGGSHAVVPSDSDVYWYQFKISYSRLFNSVESRVRPLSL